MLEQNETVQDKISRKELEALVIKLYREGRTLREILTITQLSNSGSVIYIIRKGGIEPDRKKRITRLQEDLIVLKYREEGMRVAQIAQEIGVCIKTVYDILLKHGIKTGANSKKIEREENQKGGKERW